ncbi:hypothetical protein ES703_116145 [subsurface metagenome]
MPEDGSGPKAVCYKCGNRYSGWSLAQRETCDCGGKLIINFPYDTIIGYVKRGGAGQHENVHKEGSSG